MKFIIFIVLLFGTALLVLLSGLSFPTEIALLVLILAVASDFYTTWRCKKHGGTEGNPIIARMFKKLGVPVTFGVMAGIWTLVIVFRVLPAPEQVQTAIALAYWWVPANNLVVTARLKRKCRV